MSLINFGTSLILTWYVIVFTANANQGAKFSITDTKLYVLVVTLLTEDNPKILQQLKSGSKRTGNWNKYQSKVSVERQNQYSDYLIDPGFQGVNRLFVLSFENNAHQTPKLQLIFFSNC